MKRVEYFVQWYEDNQWMSDDEQTFVKPEDAEKYIEDFYLPSAKTQIVKREITETVIKKARKQ